MVPIRRLDKAGQHVNAHPTKRKDKRTRNPKQTAWSYGLRLRAISADHGDRMCASCGKVIVLTGYGEGGAAVLGHHADSTPQGLKVFRGQADLATGRKMSWECSGGLSESPWGWAPVLADKVSFLRSWKTHVTEGEGQGQARKTGLHLPKGDTRRILLTTPIYHHFALGLVSIQSGVSTPISSSCQLQKTEVCLSARVLTRVLSYRWLETSGLQTPHHALVPTSTRLS